MLIDDDEDDRDIFNLALENAGDYSCVTAENGIEALKMLTEQGISPDYIFIDLNMPFLPGKECLAQIKQNESLANIPAIMYTTSSYEKDAEESRQLGAAHFLVKPASLNSLTAILSKIFSKAELPYYLEEA